MQSDSQINGQGTVTFGSRCSVGSVEAHAVSQFERGVYSFVNFFCRNVRRDIG